MGYDENLSGKATLAAEDIRFGRTIDRLQRILLSELYKIALVHLYAQGYRDEQMTNFTLDFNYSFYYLRSRKDCVNERKS